MEIKITTLVENTAEMGYLAQEFGGRFFLNNSGSRWTLPFEG